MRSFPLVKATNESKGEFHKITRYIDTLMLASYATQQHTAVKVNTTIMNYFSPISLNIIVLCMNSIIRNHKYYVVITTYYT